MFSWNSREQRLTFSASFVWADQRRTYQFTRFTLYFVFPLKLYHNILCMASLCGSSLACFFTAFAVAQEKKRRLPRIMFYWFIVNFYSEVVCGAKVIEFQIMWSFPLFAFAVLQISVLLRAFTACVNTTNSIRLLFTPLLILSPKILRVRFISDSPSVQLSFFYANWVVERNEILDFFSPLLSSLLRVFWFHLFIKSHIMTTRVQSYGVSTSTFVHRISFAFLINDDCV